ncbi:MAG: hypothetical protein IPJ76_07045 [Flavobacteriales bacterium]|nr:MAG: hypothetical protein IPJ76_07045 [Flavobacteriales bacterium]
MELYELKPSLQRRQKRRDKRLDEEVIECYRRGCGSKHGKGYLKRTRHSVPDGPTMHESIKARHTGERKGLNDNLEPLIRYLRSHVGKHWDKVHSDLCRSLDTNTVTGHHVMQHLKHLVHTNVVKDGMRLITHDGRQPRELKDDTWYRLPEFYVHPKSGVLMVVKHKRKQRGPNYRS